MSDENLHSAFISYLDEKGKIREGFFILIHMDASFVKFKTNSGNLITIPTARILKIKERMESEDGYS